jgi:ATP-dependent helicase YprA (DUF1998 family)
LNALVDDGCASSLPADERRESEQAFAESRYCVIVSTRTLELCIDVGDLDRAIQIDAPSTVATLVQCMGRTDALPQLPVFSSRHLTPLYRPLDYLSFGVAAG